MWLAATFLFTASSSSGNQPKTPYDCCQFLLSRRNKCKTLTNFLFGGCNHKILFGHELNTEPKFYINLKRSIPKEYKFLALLRRLGLISRTICFEFALKCEISFDFQDNLL